MQWEDYLVELHNAVEWRMVMSRGPDERSQMHAMSVLLSTCEGENWILQGSQQEQRDRTAGVQALCSLLASTTSGRAKELVKQGMSDGKGMVAFGRTRERFEKTADVAKLTEVFQFQWTSSDSLKDKWLRWLKLMRQVNMTSLEDDARETLTVAGLEKAWNYTYVFELHRLGLWCVQAWTSICERLWIRVLLSPRQWKSVLSCQRVLAVVKVDMKSRSVDCALRSVAIAAKLDISRRCAFNVRNPWSSQVPQAAVARAAGKAAQAAATPTSAIAVDRSAIEGLIALVDMRIAVAVVNEDIGVKCLNLIGVRTPTLGLSRWSLTSLNKIARRYNTCGPCRCATS